MSNHVEIYKALVGKLGLESYVKFYGFVSGQELDAHYNVNDVAVGHLASHRVGVNETSELKAREYCAKGIPFFCSSVDKDFPSTFPYRLKVPEGENLIDINEIVSFALRCRTAKEHPYEMHDYAVKNLDWSVKMRKLIEFLENDILNQTQ